MSAEGSGPFAWPPPEADTDEIAVYELSGSGLQPIATDERRSSVGSATGEPVPSAVAGAGRTRSGWRVAGALGTAALALAGAMLMPGHGGRSRSAAVRPDRLPSTTRALADTWPGALAPRLALAPTPAAGAAAGTSRRGAAARGRATADAPATAEVTPARPLRQRLPTNVPAAFPLPSGTRATLRLHIDEGGRVTSAQVVGSGAAYYEAPLLAAAREWRYVPAMRAGRPVKSRRMVEVRLR